MSNKGFIIGFGVGAAISGVVTWFITKKVIEGQYKEYYDEQEQFFVRKLAEVEAKAPIEAPTQTPTVDISEEHKEDNMPKTTTRETDAPYIISKDEYGENGYDAKQIYMYTDGVITLGDDQKLTIDEMYDVVGKDNLRDIAINAEDNIYVRNPREGIDFRVESCSYDYYDDDMDDTD